MAVVRLGGRPRGLVLRGKDDLIPHGVTQWLQSAQIVFDLCFQSPSQLR